MEPRAEVVLPGAPLAETVAFFRERLRMRLCSIRPAEAPQVAVVEGRGLRLRLDAAVTAPAGALRVEAEQSEDVVAPNGTRIELRAPAPMAVPAPTGAVVVVGAPREQDWTVGRAGMRYRDLVPGRLGGHLIASHICIPEDGPVPDDVHFHDVAAQLIHCVRGRVQLVYEDQGAAFELCAGQTVLQPPQIRHRVLSCTGSLEVVEVTSPADHLTTLDHALALPTPNVAADRRWSGQRFAVQQHGADRDLELATDGRVRVTQRQVGRDALEVGDAAHVDFLFVLEGVGALTADGSVHALATHGAATLPPGHVATVRAEDDALRLLHVQLATA